MAAESVSDPSAVWSRVAAFASAVDAGLGRWLLDVYRVGLTEYRALAYLEAAPDRELRVNDLASRVGLNQSSVTRLISRLEAKELTRRDLCPDDARGVYAVITEQGAALVREVREPYAVRVGELLAELAADSPHADAQQLSRDLRDIARLIASS